MSAEALTEAIARCVKDHKVVAFIKGTREEPDCGFSHRVVNVLHDLSIDFDTVNVLDDYYNPNILFVLKDFSDWPTIPQLYVNGEFVGGLADRQPASCPPFIWAAGRFRLTQVGTGMVLAEMEFSHVTGLEFGDVEHRLLVTLLALHDPLRCDCP